MRGTGPVTIGKDVVYAYFTTAGRQTRMRISTDEADRLDLFAGKQVSVRFGDGDSGRALITHVSPAPPFVWVEMELFTAVASRAG